MSRNRLAQAALLALALADWVGLKRGWLSHAPSLLAVLVAILLASLVIDAVRLVAATRSGRVERLRGSAGLVVVLGLLLAGSAGMANWLLSLQGYAILTESQRVELSGGEQLQEFDAGPLSDVGEMKIALTLSELELQPAPGGFLPASRLICERPGRDPVALAVRPGESAGCGSLVFHQGAFGFAPRIVIQHRGGDTFDRVVPFLTRREGESGVAFEGDFTVASEGLHVRGVVDLASLDASMRGHARLRLEVTREGHTLGHGELLPGHFAEIDNGYRIGFAGLDKWSEIDVSRRNYGRWVLAGAVLSSLGALAWALARWRGW